jgi:hypothetical protein
MGTVPTSLKVKTRGTVPTSIQVKTRGTVPTSLQVNKICKLLAFCFCLKYILVYKQSSIIEKKLFLINCAV